MTEQSLLKKSFRFDEATHIAIQAKLRRGQLSVLMRTMLACVKDILYHGDPNEVYLFINRRGPLTLDPRKKKEIQSDGTDG